MGAAGLLPCYAGLRAVDHRLILLKCVVDEGVLPDELGDLSYLVVLEVYMNEISGKCIPYGARNQSSLSQKLC